MPNHYSFAIPQAAPNHTAPSHARQRAGSSQHGTLRVTQSPGLRVPSVQEWVPTSCVPLAEASPILHPEVLPEWAIRGRRGSRNLVLQAGEAVCTQWWACGMGWGTLSHSGPSTHHAAVSRLTHLQLWCDQAGPFPGAPHLSQPLPARPVDGETHPTPPWIPAGLGKGTWVAKKQMTPWCFQAKCQLLIPAHEGRDP